MRRASLVRRRRTCARARGPPMLGYRVLAREPARRPPRALPPPALGASSVARGARLPGPQNRPKCATVISHATCISSVNFARRGRRGGRAASQHACAQSYSICFRVFAFVVAKGRLFGPADRARHAQITTFRHVVEAGLCARRVPRVLWQRAHALRRSAQPPWYTNGPSCPVPDRAGTKKVVPGADTLGPVFSRPGTPIQMAQAKCISSVNFACRGRSRGQAAPGHRCAQSYSVSFGDFPLGIVGNRFFRAAGSRACRCGARGYFLALENAPRDLPSRCASVSAPSHRGQDRLAVPHAAPWPPGCSAPGCGRGPAQEGAGAPLQKVDADDHRPRN